MVRMTLMTMVFALLLCSGAAVLHAEKHAAGKDAGTPPLSLGEIDLRSSSGEQVSLIPFIGRKSVVVMFWAAWCPICKAEVPRLNRLHADPGIKVFGVNEGDELHMIQAFVTSNNVGYQIIVDPDAKVAGSFGVPGMPYCVIIGRTGTIVYRGNGLPADLDYYLGR
jgi:peroxiredoxin